MKTLSSDQLNQLNREAFWGGAQGLIAGLAVALPTSYIFNRQWPYYRQLPPSLKALGVVVVALPACVVGAERASMRYEQESWIGALQEQRDALRAREEARWKEMGFGDKIRDVARRHQYGIIGGTWAASVLAAWGIIMRKPYQTTPQKVVQVRMWAQGLTIGVIIAAAVLTQSQRRESMSKQDPMRHIPSDQSWREVVGEESREEAAQRQQKQQK